MSDQEQASGQTQSPADSEKNQDSENPVPYSTYKKAVTEKRNRDAELKEAREQLAKFEQEKKELEEKSLREKEDYKKLFEARETELKSEREKRLEIEAHITNSKKLRGFLSTLGSPLEEQYMDLIDLNKIALDQEGKPDEVVVKQYADEFKKKYWRVFDTTTQKIPNDSGNGSQRIGLTYEQWLKLPRAEQTKRMNEVKL